MNKVAITSEGPGLESKVDGRFGRAAGFVLVDLETMALDYLENGASQALSQGAGIQAAEMVAQAGAKAVLTGFVGPKAFHALKAAGIQVAQDLEGMTVREALDRWREGRAAAADQPNRGGSGRGGGGRGGGRA
jgi:predicted Fe-Mo cluster-binding NifX family protein